MIFTPSTGFHHQVGRTLFSCLILRQLSQYRHILRQCRVANKKLDKEWFVFTCLSFLGSKGVPPPIIAVMGQRTMQHAGISGDIVMVKHFQPLLKEL